MKIATLHEITSKEKLRAGLGLAIAEARMVRALIENKTTDPAPEEIKKLVNLEREIDYLETTLFELKLEDPQ